MRIQADINNKGQVTISCFFALPLEGKSGEVVFVIDTGSPLTILSESDAIKLDINPENFKGSTKPLIGLGGRAEPHVLTNVVMIFNSDSGSQIEEMKEIIVTKIRVKDEKLKKTLMSFPSLLGRDFLIEFGYKLFIDLKENIAYVEKER